MSRQLSATLHLRHLPPPSLPYGGLRRWGVITTSPRLRTTSKTGFSRHVSPRRATSRTKRSSQQTTPRTDHYPLYLGTPTPCQGYITSPGSQPGQTLSRFPRRKGLTSPGTLILLLTGSPCSSGSLLSGAVFSHGWLPLCVCIFWLICVLVFIYSCVSFCRVFYVMLHCILRSHFFLV